MWRKNLNLLVVDDDATSRDMLCKILSSFGYGCTSARNSVEAVEAFIKRKGKISALVVDWNMPPYNNGGQLLEDLRKLDPSLLAILVTGSMPEDTSNFHLALNKPVDIGKLVKGLDSMLKSN